MGIKDIDQLAWRMMFENEEYEELNRIFALNGIICEGYLETLSEDERDDITRRLAIGIQAFNAQVKQSIKDQHDWHRLPNIKISGEFNE